MEGRGDHVAVARLFQTPAVVPIAPQDFLWLPSPASPAPPVRAEQAEPAVYGAQQATGDLGSRLLVRAVVRAVHSCSRLRCKTWEQDGRKEGFYLKEGRKEGGRISARGFSYGPWSVQFTAVADFAAKHGNRMEGRKGFI